MRVDVAVTELVIVAVGVSVAVEVSVTVTLGVFDGVRDGATVGVASGTPGKRLQANIAQVKARVSTNSRADTCGFMSLL